MSKLETLLYEEKDGVAWVTLNRPDTFNAFNAKMQQELRDLWRGLRRNDEVRCVVLTGAGDKAFCSGIDRVETMADYGKPQASKQKSIGSGSTPFMFDDPGANVGPKTNDLWKPVIAAVNGIACGGAFYMLGEVEFIIAAETATFFDPHVTYGMTAAFEPMHMLQKMPFHEIMRLSLLGNYERLSAKRAYEVGLVSEVVPGDKLREAAEWAAKIIASQPPLAIQGTLRAAWMAHEHFRRDAVAQISMIVSLGTKYENIQAGQESFHGRREKPRIR